MRGNTIRPFTTQEIAFLSLLTAACVVGRLMFQFIPNVQPMTALLIMIALHFGFSRGVIVTVLSLLITNFYLGMGVWTFSQITGFSLILLFACLLLLVFVLVMAEVNQMLSFCLGFSSESHRSARHLHDMLQAVLYPLLS